MLKSREKWRRLATGAVGAIIAVLVAFTVVWGSFRLFPHANPDVLAVPDLIVVLLALHLLGTLRKRRREALAKRQAQDQLGPGRRAG